MNAEAEIRINAMRLEDLDACMRLWQSVDMVREQDMRARVTTLIGHVPNLCRVALKDGSIVGCVLCNHNEFSAHLFRLVVARPQRHRGVGNSLVAACETAAVAAGAAKMSLDTSGDVAEWLGRHGYAVTPDRFLFKLLQ